MRSEVLELSSASEAAIKAHLKRALAGDEAAMRGLVQALTPVIQGRVARTLLRRAPSARGRNTRQELEDLVQEVFAALLSHQGRALLAWDQARGLSFERFVAFLAEREVGMIMRTGKRNPWTEDPTLDDTIVRLGGSSASHEELVASRELLEQLGERLRERLSPKGRQFFQLLYIEDQSVDAVAQSTGASPDALYAWRSRLSRLVRELRDELAMEDAHGR